MSDSEWTKKWTELAAKVRSVDQLDASKTITHSDSAAILRNIVRSNLLRFTDVQRNPLRFFEAHRILAARAPALGPGFWIRFTVQYNLFAGSIAALGDAEQLDALDAMQARGTLGCFALTEKLAGVNSGMVANTTAVYDTESTTFSISTPTQGAHKNWISQGFVADSAVVVASLTDGTGAKCGPTAFVVKLRDEASGALAPGVTVTDMGGKTVGNDLDNVALAFDNVTVPRSAMLSRYASVDSEGRCAPTAAGTGVSAFAMVGQRLFTGRVAVAQAALTFSRELFAETRRYSDAKACWPKGALSDVPQLRSLYTEAGKRFNALDALVAKCEGDLAEALLADTVPSADLVEAIAVCKVSAIRSVSRTLQRPACVDRFVSRTRTPDRSADMRGTFRSRMHCVLRFTPRDPNDAQVRAVEEAIELCFRLKQEVGSYALMSGTAFEQLDFLQCCKFAEGDSRILMLKMGRDAMRSYAKHGRVGGAGAAADDEAERLCAEIAAASEAGTSEEDGEWEKIFCLAEMTMARVSKRVCP